MNRTRALIVSLAVAVAASAGVLALGNTVTLGAKANVTSDAQIAQRTAQLNRYEASLRAALTRKLPPLPSVPSSTSQAPALASAPQARIVYHRPPPVVVITHRAGGGEHDNEGGGFDD